MFITAILTAAIGMAPLPEKAAPPAPAYARLHGTGDVHRTALTFHDLHGAAAALVDMSAFAMPEVAAHPENIFMGTLTLDTGDTTKVFAEVGTSGQASYKDPGTLPRFSFQFIQHGSHIFPVQRGLIHTRHPDWNYILEPGRVWQEAGDQGFSRVSMPFALQQAGENCTHNGVLSFAFRSGDARMSKVAYQIASETCQYFQFNMWGLASARYTPEPIPGAALMQAGYETEVAARMPVKPIAELAQAFPHAGIDIASIGSEQSASYRTVYGVAVDGVNYVGGCATRAGAYPYCEVLDIPSYSIAKSIVGGIGLMRLEKKFPGSQVDLSIGASVRQCSGKGWDDVTLLHALDMSTGHYSSAGFVIDEGSPAMENSFFVPATYRRKAAHACGYARKLPPGRTWVYHTSDTFLLGAAMQAAVQAVQGPSSDFYRDLIVAELWKPLKLSPTAYTSARTRDETRLPFTGYGLTLHHDDLVKVAEFLNKNNGAIAPGGPPMLDARLLSEAMQKTNRRGLSIGRKNGRYQHGFWAWDAADATSLLPGESSLCARSKWIAYMSGFGGIGVMLLPNDMVYYFVSDKNEFGFRRTLAELNKIRSLC